MQVIFLCRHGESVYSKAGVVNGDPTLPGGLTARGRRQAVELGRALAREPIDLVVVSPFPRTRETAALALSGRDVPVLVCPALGEIRFGDLEGGSVAAYRAFVHSHPLDTPLPGGGESQVEAGRRYLVAFRRLMDRPEASIAVVTHGLPVGLLLNAAEGLPPLPVAGRDVPLATPHRFTADTFATALARIGAWLDAFTPTRGPDGQGAPARSSSTRRDSPPRPA